MVQALAAGGACTFCAVQALEVEELAAGGGLLGTLLRCHLRYAGSDEGAPQSVIVKLPGGRGKNRGMVRRLEMHRREYDFYRLAAGQAQVRTPRLYYGDCDARGTRFVLVLEDLGEMEQGDQAAGASREQAMAALRALARLHGSFWNGKTGRLAGLYDLLARRRRGWLQLAYALFLARTLARYGSLFTPEMRRLAEAYAPRVAEHVARVAAGPISLIHGDFRLDNLFFGREDGADAAVIDWQVSGWSAPLYDVAYFLGSSVTTELRREIERDALAQYAEIMRSMGAEGFSDEVCWRLYRECMLGRLLPLALVCGGLDLVDAGARTLAEIGVQRTLTAIEDLDAGACMPGRPRWWSGSGVLGAASRGVFEVGRWST